MSTKTLEKIKEKYTKRFSYIKKAIAEGELDFEQLWSFIIEVYQTAYKEGREEEKSKIADLTVDIAHAIGYCRGLGKPESYLEKKYKKVLDSLNQK